MLNPVIAVLVAAAMSLAWQSCAAQTPHNVILFIPDGMRAGMVDERNAPAMASARDRGVNFKNSHSLFPTFTMPNSSAMATGHYLGDTGTFSNTIFTGFAVASAGGSITPFIENDAVLGEVDAHFAGDYVNETTLLAAARAAGFSTATMGQTRSGAGLRSHRAQRRADHRLR